MALSGVQHWWLLEGYLGVAWSSHFKQNMTRVLNNSWALKLIFFWLFWSSIALSSSIHRHICKGCPLPWRSLASLLPVRTAPANFYFWSGCCKAALAALVPGPGGRTRDQLMKVTCARCTDQFILASNRPKVRPTVLSWWLQWLPHSYSSLAFNNTQLRPGQHHNNMTQGRRE